MRSRLFLCCALLPALAAAYCLDLRQTVTCSYSVVAGNGDTCDSLASSWGLTVPNFEALNPGISCPTLVVDQQYCVLGTVSVPPTTTSSSSTVSSTSAKSQTSTKSSTSTTHPPPTTSSKTTKSTSTTSSLLHEPTQSGLVANCKCTFMPTAIPIQTEEQLTQKRTLQAINSTTSTLATPALRL